MSKPNGAIAAPLIFLLVFISGFSSEFCVHGSPTQEHTFKRPDPLGHFKFYNGGFNVTNKHYWASLAFTGVHGYAIAAIWVICGLVFGILALKIQSRNDSSSSITDRFDGYYFSMFILVLVFTILAIGAISLVLAANQSSLARTNRLKKTILKAGKDAHGTIRKVIKVMREMENILLPYDRRTSVRLNITAHQLGKESKTIQHFNERIGHSMDQAIQTSYISHLVVVSVNLALIVTALVLFLLHWYPGFIIVILFCWIITTLCWVLTGFDFFLNTFARDTCATLENFESNPQNNSLTSIIPCMDSSYSDRVMAEIGGTIHYFIAKLNSKIIEVYSKLGLNKQSEDSLGFGTICDPFSGAPNYKYAPENHPKDCVPIGKLPDVLSSFTCYSNNSPEACRNNGKFLPQGSYELAWVYSQSVQDMLNIYPDLQSLSQCKIVKETFSDVVLHQCRPFKRSIRLLWGSMLSLSIIMVVLVLIWVAKAYQDRGRSFNRCSILPNQT
ncbi:hypothetical protein HS088_TW01G00746 [Tripterygium wilfordii]|uniref:Transmembrane protein n=1 Tax=Tripterygium wilfordii TaxID=458696 RepID=A0A7J7E2J8_TRIWF|nr:uncharacterized protein LOC120002507 isoform X2 [Tripterygium wilfordii]KAF5752828.1 hypothetical protein HS088_TW01G00746 [Tripterygium wilfordii]